MITEINQMAQLNLDVLLYENDGLSIYTEVFYDPVAFDSLEASKKPPVSVTICCGCTWRCGGGDVDTK